MKIETGTSAGVSTARFDTERIVARGIWVGCKTTWIGGCFLNENRKKTKRKSNKTTSGLEIKTISFDLFIFQQETSTNDTYPWKADLNCKDRLDNWEERQRI